MADTIKVFTVAHVPRALAQEWLQHLRDFDTAHPGCHFEVMADAPDIPLKEMFEMVKVDPALTFSEVIERTKAAPNNKPVVHILHVGLPLCRFMIGRLVDWPRNHFWVGLDEREKATCDICAAVADKRGELK